MKKFDAKRLKRKLTMPVGFTVEWMTGGIDFRPPLWAWFVLEGALFAYMVLFR